MVSGRLEILFNHRAPRDSQLFGSGRGYRFGFGPQVEVPRNFRVAVRHMGRANYDMMPDGRILGLLTPLEQGGAEAPREIRVVVNWFEELKGKRPK